MTTPTAPPRSPAEQARLDAALTDLVQHRIPFNQVLGLKVHSLRPEFRVRFAMRPDLVGHDLTGRLHGGVISAALDAMGGCALMQAIGDKHPSDSAEQVMHRFSRLGTIDLRVDASAEVTRLGGRVGSVQMRLINDSDELIATAAAAYIVS
ncbi:MAG: thioesterase family protein [Burkholderiales bacterium]|nr:thioesterase family protein [Burkholderiales bacterium]